jgi:hypothetical protein
MHTATLTAASEWLASADPDPSRAHRWMTQTNIVMLPLGKLFDAVRVPTEKGQVALDAGIGGPVVCSPEDDVHYFLVPPGTDTTWAHTTEIMCWGDGTYLMVPSLLVTTPPNVHWVQAPDGTGTLVEPEGLAASLAGAV